jgi:hypothetical protein
MSGMEVLTWQSADTSPDFTSLESQFVRYRVVSWGVRATCPQAPTDQKGILRVVTLPSSPVTGAFDASGGFFEEIAEYPLAGLDVHWVSKPIGSAWKEYKDMDYVNSDWWNSVVFVAEGMSDKDPGLRFEVVVNLECQVGLDALAGGLATDAADHNPRVMVAVDKARKSHGHATNGRQGFFRALAGAARAGISHAVSVFGPPVLRSLVPRLLGPPRMGALTNGAPIEID